MVPVSKRMKAIADMVSDGLSVADIGCDHGFVSIYLVNEKHAPRVIAMDVNKGPLLRAKEHILQYGLDEVIETRLSDGAQKLAPGEVEAAVIAGMGGRLTIRIIEESFDKFKAMKEFVLSPHSDVSVVREYLCGAGFEILDEDMVFDEDKYYSIMKCRYEGSVRKLSSEQMAYGPILLDKKHSVLREFLLMKKDKLTELETVLTESLQNVPEDRREAIEERCYEVNTEKKTIEGLLLLM